MTRFDTLCAALLTVDVVALHLWADRLGAVLRAV